MSYHQTGSGEPGQGVCQYSGSRLWFRGPERSLDTPYIACAGGDETYGRFVDRPFPKILEAKLDRRCLNLGSLFCGVDAVCGDKGLFNILNKADLCILQAPGVLGQSNRFYRVHPRRNDRILGPTQELTSLYPEVDFAEVHFVRHLISLLQGHQDARFELVAEALRKNWVRRIKDLLNRVKAPVILLRLSVVREWGLSDPVDGNLLSITDQMLAEVRPLCAVCTDVSVFASGLSDEIEDMLFGTLQKPMAEHMVGPAGHKSIADTLFRAVQDLN